MFDTTRLLPWLTEALRQQSTLEAEQSRPHDEPKSSAAGFAQSVHLCKPNADDWVFAVRDCKLASSGSRG
jgi:hypothetical protein